MRQKRLTWNAEDSGESHALPSRFAASSMYRHLVFGFAFIKTRAMSSGDASMRSGISCLRGLPTGRLAFVDIPRCYM